jgi:hypothetical protein
LFVFAPVFTAFSGPQRGRDIYAPALAAAMHENIANIIIPRTDFQLQQDKKDNKKTQKSNNYGPPNLLQKGIFSYKICCNGG